MLGAHTMYLHTEYTDTNDWTRDVIRRSSKQETVVPLPRLVYSFQRLTTLLIVPCMCSFVCHNLTSSSFLSAQIGEEDRTILISKIWEPCTLLSATQWTRSCLGRAALSPCRYVCRVCQQDRRAHGETIAYPSQTKSAGLQDCSCKPENRLMIEAGGYRTPLVPPS